MASFMDVFCDLPQYSQTIRRNFSGPALRELSAHGMLGKGLARAGICDPCDQQRFVSAVRKLESSSTEELCMELGAHIRRRELCQRQSPPRRALLKTASSASAPQILIAGPGKPTVFATTKVVMRAGAVAYTPAPSATASQMTALRRKQILDESGHGTPLLWSKPIPVSMDKQSSPAEPSLPPDVGEEAQNVPNLGEVLSAEAGPAASTEQSGKACFLTEDDSLLAAGISGRPSIEDDSGHDGM